MIPLYDVFHSVSGKEVLWIESVEGLDAARARVKHLAEETPGSYFIFSSRTGQVVGTFDAAGTVGREKAAAQSA